MKEKLAIQVVFTERNAEMLEKIPHKEVEDIALAKHLRIPTTTIDGIEVIEAKKKNKK